MLHHVKALLELRNILSVLLVCLTLPCAAELCLPSSSSTVKEEKGNRDNLSGNRAEAESQSLTGGMNTESLGRVTAGPELQSHRPA